MPDKVSKETRHNIMKSIKSTHSKIENIVTKSLWHKGIRFRRNVKDLPGKPDIAIKKYKIVIFIDSCFWHGCELHCKLPKSNIAYWKKKIESNMQRDMIINKYYSENGWNIMRAWEHQLKDNLPETILSIYNFIINAKNA